MNVLIAKSNFDLNKTLNKAHNWIEIRKYTQQKYLKSSFSFKILPILLKKKKKMHGLQEND